MREIKFRAWDTYEERMYPVFQMDFEKWIATPYQIAEDEWNLEQRELDSVKIMQYTGLKDKNGVEIFEGDVLKLQLATGLKAFVEVKFTDGCFDICAIHGHIYTESRPNGRTLHRKRDYLKCYTVNHAVEIIGNLYENPELIKQEAT